MWVYLCLSQEQMRVMVMTVVVVVVMVLKWDTDKGLDKDELTDTIPIFYQVTTSNH